MPLPSDLPVVDHHCHLSPTGEGIGAAQRFAAAGGTHLILATQNYTGTVPRRIEDYRDQFDITFRLAQSIRTETGVDVRCVVGPYPIDLVHAAPILGVEAALALQREAADLAGRFVPGGARGRLGRGWHAPLPRRRADPARRRARVGPRVRGRPTPTVRRSCTRPTWMRQGTGSSPPAPREPGSPPTGS